MMSSSLDRISVIILTNNNEKRIARVLKAVESFAEILVIDTGSTDETISIARTFPQVKVYSKPFTSLGRIRNDASQRASHDWILSIDSDEILEKAALSELASLSLDPQAVYSFPFKNFYRDRWIRCCGWYPDRHVRLYHRKETQFKQAHIHEGVITSHLRTISLSSHILHYSYNDISDFLDKMHRYTELFVREYQGKRSASFLTAFFHGMGAFIKNYCFQRGWLYGQIGFTLAFYKASAAYFKYLALCEKNHDLSP